MRLRGKKGRSRQDEIQCPGVGPKQASEKRLGQKNSTLSPTLQALEGHGATKRADCFNMLPLHLLGLVVVHVTSLQRLDYIVICSVCLKQRDNT